MAALALKGETIPAVDMRSGTVHLAAIPSAQLAMDTFHNLPFEADEKSAGTDQISVDFSTVQHESGGLVLVLRPVVKNADGFVLSEIERPVEIRLTRTKGAIDLPLFQMSAPIFRAQLGR